MLEMEPNSADLNYTQPRYNNVSYFTAGASSASSHLPSTSTEPSTDAIATILPTKRKARSQRVCQPCRLRKVKSSYTSPCQTCIERGHPELCHYLPEQPSKRVYMSVAPPLDPQTNDTQRQMLSKEKWIGDRISAVEAILKELRDAVQHIQRDIRQGVPASLNSTQVDSASTPGESAVVKG